MEFDGSRTMHEHVIEMTNIAAKLKSLGMVVDENFLVQFILNSLSFEYGPFQMNYNTIKDKCNMHELHSITTRKYAFYIGYLHLFTSVIMRRCSPVSLKHNDG